MVKVWRAPSARPRVSFIVFPRYFHSWFQASTLNYGRIDAAILHSGRATRQARSRLALSAWRCVKLKCGWLPDR